MQIEITWDEISTIYAALGIAKEDYEHRLSQNPESDYSLEDQTQMHEFLEKCTELEDRLNPYIHPSDQRKGK